jgi:DNA-binding IclR family transcriptional regulator
MKINNSSLPEHSLKTASSEGRVSAIAKAVALLDCFTGTQSELTLTQLSQLLGIPKSTLLNQIRTLEDTGYLLKVRGTQSYRMGYKVMELSYHARNAMPIIQYALPLMEQLQVDTGEIVYLTSHIGGKVFYLECVYPSRRSIAYSVSGKTLPMYCTSCGKAMLSMMQPEQSDAILTQYGLPPRTPNTITDRTVLLHEMEECRQRGYAVDNEEESIGVRCVAVPICTGIGEVAGSLSVSGSVLTMTPEHIARCAELLSRARYTLSPYASLFPAIQI